MYHGLIFSYRKERIERGNGAHRIATFLRSYDWDVEVIDFCSEWTQEELQELVKSRVGPNTKFFGFSSFISYWTSSANKFTAWLKKTYPGIATMIGGQGCLLTPAENIDYWIDSFGEYAVLELLKYITGNTIIDGRFQLEDSNGKKIIKALRDFPAWNMPSYRVNYQKRDFIESYEMLTIETSRGCRFKCDFCNFPILGVKDDVSRTANDFKEELLFNYNEYGVKNYTIADETFNDRREKIIKYAEAVNDLDFDPWFMAFMRGDLLVNQRDLWGDMLSLGLGGHFYGIETFNHNAGKIIGKGMQPDKLKQGLIDARNYFEPHNIYRGTISLICGLPKETPETFADGINWCKSNWKGQSVTSWYLEVPEYNSPMTNLSAFSKNLEKYGLRRRKMIKKSKKVSDHVLTTYFPSLESMSIWEHDGMDQLQAIEILDNFYETVYPKYFITTGFSAPTGLVQYQTNDIKEIIRLEKYNDKSPFINNHVSEYKRKKLDWKP